MTKKKKRSLKNFSHFNFFKYIFYLKNKTKIWPSSEIRQRKLNSNVVDSRLQSLVTCSLTELSPSCPALCSCRSTMSHWDFQCWSSPAARWLQSSSSARERRAVVGPSSPSSSGVKRSKCAECGCSGIFSLFCLLGTFLICKLKRWC